jgi:hypothetical protein
MLFGILFGCSTIEIYSDYDPWANFSGLKTFSWIPGPQKETGDPRIDNPLLDAHIRNAVEDQLALNGFEKKGTEKPDFWIGYHAAIDRKLGAQTINHFYAYPPGWAWEHYRTPYVPPGMAITETEIFYYDEGTLILDVVDPETRKLIWRGSAQAEVKYATNPEKRNERIKEAVRRILERFPPKKP